MTKRPEDELDRDTLHAVISLVEEIEEEVLDEDKTGATRDQMVEGTCQRIRDRIRERIEEPVHDVELNEAEAVEELGGGASLDAE